jgi:Metal-dependent hydrolase involved in phosphonate metabolism
MIINNVKLVLEDEVVQGSLEMQDGIIRAFAESQSRHPEALDGEGGWLLPGLMSCIPIISTNSSPRARRWTGPLIPP